MWRFEHAAATGAVEPARTPATRNRFEEIFELVASIA